MPIFTTISGHFFANYMVIFHKSEVQTVVLRCLTGLHLDWFRHCGLRCRWRPCTCLANSQKIATDKWPFYDHIWTFFCQLYVYFSQNWGSEGYFNGQKWSQKSHLPVLFIFTQTILILTQPFFTFYFIQRYPSSI